MSKRYKVVSYETSRAGDPTLAITPMQERRLRAARCWPRGRNGDHYTSVAYGLHYVDYPTFTGAEIARLCAGEHAMDVRDSVLSDANSAASAGDYEDYWRLRLAAEA